VSRTSARAAHQGVDPHALSPAPLQSLYSSRPGAQGRVCIFRGPLLSERCGEGPAPPDDLCSTKPFSSLRAFLGSLKTHSDNIPRVSASAIRPDVPEELDRIIEIDTSQVSRQRNLDVFTDIIYLVVGDVAIPARIPRML